MKLNDQDLKEVIKIINSLERHYRNDFNEELEREHVALKEKIIRIITKQPDPIPYCNCMEPDFNHSFKTPFCNKCYGVPNNYK